MTDLGGSSLAWCRTGDHLVFLDLASDRYFRLPRERERRCLIRLAEGNAASWHQPDVLPRPEDWSPARAASPARETGDFRLNAVARALWVQRRIERRIASGVFLPVLQDLRRARTRCEAPNEELSEAGSVMVRAFEQARLLRSAADRCLARSIALAGCLTAGHDACHVVLGVTSLPFSAHCWAQKGEVVLNDTFEEVQRYTPILVV